MVKHGACHLLRLHATKVGAAMETVHKTRDAGPHLQRAIAILLYEWLVLQRTMTEVIRLERAASSRSTCRLTGEVIEKDSWRVGVEGWISGRMGTIWQKPEPFLKGCVLESSTTGRASCKKTGTKFAVGDLRFAAPANASRLYLTVEAAGQLLKPILEVVPSFKPIQMQGLDQLAQEDRQSFYKAFGVPPSQARRFDKEHPAPEAGEARPAVKRVKREQGASGGGSEAGGAAGSSGGAAAGAAAAATDAAAAAADGGGAERDGAEGGAGSAEGAGGGGSEEPATEKGRKRKSRSPKEAATYKQVEPETPEWEELTEYEREREMLIRRNRERLAALQIPELVSEMAARMPKARPGAAKGVSAKKTKAVSTEPPRRSLRVQGIQADPQMAITHELPNGTVLLAGGRSGGPAAPAGPRQYQEPVPFQSENADDTSDAAFLRLLATSTAPPSTPDIDLPLASRHNSTHPHAPTTPSTMSLAALRGAKLAQADVAKITKDSIACMAFHPDLDTAVLAAGDKAGKVGLWHVDYEAGALRADEEEGFDGVLMMAPHKEYVSALKWVGAPGAGRKLLTAAYDGGLMTLDPGQGSFLPAAGLDPDGEFSAMEATSDGNTVFLGDPQGNFDVYDVRAGKLAFDGVNLRTRKINTLHLEPSSSRLLAASSTDCSVTVWDIRKFTGSHKGLKPLSEVSHLKSCQAAYWAPDGSRRILSTSFDDTLRIWQDPSFSAPSGRAHKDALLAGGSGILEAHRMRHNNNTGRWLSPFRAVWGPLGDCCLVGDMKRMVQVYTGEGKEAGVLRSEYMTAIPTRLCVHPVLGIVAGATSSGRVHIYRA